MIKKEDIKVGLRFHITRNDCLKCNFDPICVHDNSPILFIIERMVLRGYAHLLVSAISFLLILLQKT
jgi:hypothetical protein